MKNIIFFIIGLVVFACNSGKEKAPEVIEDVVSPEVFKSDIVALDYVEYDLDDKAKTLLAAWDKYNQLDTNINLLKAGDLSFFKSDMKVLETFMRELKTSMPEAVKTPSIEARVLALETKMLKLQSVLSLQNESEEIQLEAVKETLEAFSNLNLQINKKLEKDAQNIVKP